jgi:hypothetical protein
MLKLEFKKPIKFIESKTAATIMDLPIRRLLPLEMNCEIFKCLKWPIHAKFIWGLGRGIYTMFGQKLLIKVFLHKMPVFKCHD